MGVQRSFLLLPSFVTATLVLGSPTLTQGPTEPGGEAGTGTTIQAPIPTDVIMCQDDCSASKTSSPGDMPEDISPIIPDPD